MVSQNASAAGSGRIVAEAGPWEQAVRSREEGDAEGDWQQMQADWDDNYDQGDETDDDEHKSPPVSPKVWLDIS